MLSVHKNMSQLYCADTERESRSKRCNLTEKPKSICGTITPLRPYANFSRVRSVRNSSITYPHRIPTLTHISTISKHALISAWICHCRRIVSRTISNAGTIFASTNMPRRERKQTGRRNRSCMNNLPVSPKNTCRLNTISAAPSFASLPALLLT